MISIGIIGGTGYTGKKLLEICSKHKSINSIKVYGNSSAGNNLYSLFPELTKIIIDEKINSIDKISDEHDFYFTALPHGEALKYVPQLIQMNKKVIDLGGDYRFDDPDVYSMWYGISHSSSELLKQKTYGLADYCNGYNGTVLISNPGCYPTSVLLSLLPLEKFGDEMVSISTVSYSGTSGAGKSAKPELLLSEMHSNVAAYNVNKHRHQPEIEQELKKSGINSPFSFTTHLLPIPVGIYSTSVVHLSSKIDEKEILNSFNDAYENKFFIRLREVPPNLKWVIGTNFCDINVSVSQKTIVITSAIDNLIKGASGQAVQNMNKLYGIDETTGLGGNNVH